MKANIKDAEHLISLINGSRYFHELYLINIGKGLYNAYNGSYKGLLSWITHTQDVYKHLSFDKLPYFITRYSNSESKDRFSLLSESFSGLYHGFDENNLITIKTLAWYAREDSPKQYRKWHNKRYKKKILSLLMSGSNDDIARVIYIFGMLDFIYSFPEKKWLYFTDHGWFEDKDNDKIRDFISSILRPYIINLIKDFIQKNEENTADYIKCNRLLFKLSSRSFINNVINSSICYFGTPHMLDNNPNITRVTNGVLEISNTSVIYRYGIPEDYLSLCTGVGYNCDYTWDHIDITICVDWLRTIIPNRDFVEKFLLICSNWMRRHNNTSIHYDFLGQVNIINILLHYVFDDYFNTRIKFIGECNIDPHDDNITEEIIKMAPSFFWIICNYS